MEREGMPLRPREQMGYDEERGVGIIGLDLHSPIQGVDSGRFDDISSGLTYGPYTRNDSENEKLT